MIPLGLKETKEIELQEPFKVNNRQGDSYIILTVRDLDLGALTELSGSDTAYYIKVLILFYRFRHCSEIHYFYILCDKITLQLQYLTKRCAIFQIIFRWPFYMKHSVSVY